MSNSTAGTRGSKDKNGKGQPSCRSNNSITTPPSPRRSWIKIGVVGRARSVENMHPMGEQYHVSPRPKSPPLTLTTGSPGVVGNNIPVSPLDTPPKKLWENGFKSFLSKRSQQPTTATASTFPEVPLMAPTHRDKQKQSSGKTGKGSSSADQSVRGGNIFQSIFGVSGHSQRKQNRKTKSLNELDEPMRGGKEKNFSATSTPHRRVQSQVNVGTASGATGNGEDLDQRMRRATYAGTSASGANDQEGDLDQRMRRATFAGTTASAIVPPQHVNQTGFLAHQNFQPHIHHHYLEHSHPHQQQHYNPLSHRPSTEYHAHHAHVDMMHQRQAYPSHPQYPQTHPHQAYPSQPQYPPANPRQPAALPIARTNTFHSPVPSGSSAHSMSPSSATTEIKKAFTEFHNSSLYAKDSTSAYLGDDPSTLRGDMLKSGLAAQNRLSLRHASAGSMDNNNSGHRYWGNPRSLPTVDENVSIHKSMRMLRPFQMTDSWQTGRRYLIGPAALATCPWLQGITYLSASTNSRNEMETLNGQLGNTNVGEKDEHNSGSGTDLQLTQLPPLFGCIVLGRALLSYVVQEPQQRHQQRWWSSSILILRQNYLLEYDRHAGNTVQGLPRGYAHLQYSTSYAHPDFVDALELEFFVSPCAKADKRVLTIRLQEAREKRDNWITCLNRAATIGISDMYDYDESAEVGRGRYATVFPARRRSQGNLTKQHGDRGGNDTSSSGHVQGTVPLDENDCALKIIDKKEFWRRVVKGRERADTLVREASVQATMTSKCSKMPAFVRLRGFFETSENVVLELDLLEGIDLFQYVSSKGILSEKEAACILRDILTVLDGLNRVGVAHRDIKPANCLMCNTGHDGDLPDTTATVVKVADFGMATFVGVDGLVRGRCGTPGYVAPEIFSAGLHGGYGNKVDIFSTGVTLYVMLCGYEPFYGESDEELVTANKKAQFDFPANDWNNVSPEAKDLVKCMMEADPQQRLSAKEALGHPWIVGHVGTTDSIEVLGHSGVDSLSHSIHNRRDSCTIS